MKEYHTRLMASHLSRRLGVDQATIEKLIKEYWNGRNFTTWSAEDALQAAMNRGVTISLEYGAKVIDHAVRHHDANIGINWQTIQAAFDDIYNPGEQGTLAGVEEVEDEQ